MKKLLIILLFAKFNLIAQKECTWKVVDNKTKIPIPYAIIKIADKIFYTDSIGKCFINKEIVLEDIKISCIGYQSQSLFKSKNCEEIIYLNPKEIILPEVEISYKKGRLKTLGSLKKTTNTLAMPNHSIIAVYFSNESKNNKIIRKILLPYKTNGVISSSFRLHLFSVNKNNIPESELIEKNIISLPTDKKGELEFDVSQFNIAIPNNGIFIGIEWLSSERNDGEDIRYKKTSDILIFFKKKPKKILPILEKSIRTKFEWLPSFLSNNMSISIGVIVEEI